MDAVAGFLAGRLAATTDPKWAGGQARARAKCASARGRCACDGPRVTACLEWLDVIWAEDVNGGLKDGSGRTEAGGP